MTRAAIFLDVLSLLVLRVPFFFLPCSVLDRIMIYVNLIEILAEKKIFFVQTYCNIRMIENVLQYLQYTSIYYICGGDSANKNK